MDSKSGAVKVPESKITQELVELIQENIQSGISACFTIVLILLIASCVLVIFGIWFTPPILSIVNNVTGFTGLFDWLPLATILGSGISAIVCLRFLVLRRSVKSGIDAPLLHLERFSRIDRNSSLLGLVFGCTLAIIAGGVMAMFLCLDHAINGSFNFIMAPYYSCGVGFAIGASITAFIIVDASFGFLAKGKTSGFFEWLRKWGRRRRWRKHPEKKKKWECLQEILLKMDLGFSA